MSHLKNKLFCRIDLCIRHLPLQLSLSEGPTHTFMLLCVYGLNSDVKARREAWFRGWEFASADPSSPGYDLPMVRVLIPRPRQAPRYNKNTWREITASKNARASYSIERCYMYTWNKQAQGEGRRHYKFVRSTKFQLFCCLSACVCHWYKLTLLRRVKLA